MITRYDKKKLLTDEDFILQSFRNYDNGETRYYVQGAFTMTHGDAKQFREEIIKRYNTKTQESQS